MKYSIVIPCYNESENLVDLVNAIKKIPKKYKVEFILVENGSLDNSKEIFEKLDIDNKMIKLVYVKKNQGYGYGIIQGLKKAKGEYVGWIHADLQYNPVDLIPFFDYINMNDEKDLLLKGKRKNRKLIEYIFTYGMGIYDSLVFKKKMRDVMSMPVIFNKILLKYIEHFPYDYSIDIYVYALALKLNYDVVHLPITLKNREKGKSSWNTGVISRIKQSKKMMVASKRVKKNLESMIIMNNKIHLIMPMGGEGSRFFKNGFIVPKPLIEIKNKPFLYWSTISISKFIDVADITFVILQKHIDDNNIDKVIKEYFPKSKIQVIPQVLNGAVLTCMEGIKKIDDDLPIIFNDCDHLFICKKFYDYCQKGEFQELDGALLTFKSTDPKYSFLEMDSNGNVIQTVEKQAISDNAICGAYYFKNKNVFLKYAKSYLKNCDYKEYFVSGVYNEMAKQKLKIANFVCDEHLAFGTPDEYYLAEKSDAFERILK